MSDAPEHLRRGAMIIGRYGRRMSVARTAAALLVVLGVALVSGCGDGTGEAGPTPSAGGSTAPEEEPEYVPGPLEVYLGYTGSVRTAGDVVAEVTRRENAVAGCMALQGFEYTPLVPSVGAVEELEGPVPGTRAFVEQWGYGVWSSPPGGGGAGFQYEFEEDPNWVRREAMSDAEREAYDTALYGPVVESDASGETRSGGCADNSLAAEGDRAELLASVRDEASAYLLTLDEDARFDEVDAAWASCMADAGFTFASPKAAGQAFWDELDAVASGGAVDPALAAERAPEEVRVATADLDCQEVTDWAARHRAIELELQQEYVDAHLADLEALAEALAALGG